ncbi:MAG: hypothetical protein JXQ71_12230 [Verrucomicrobia bacterium]|nr:hypothetical protein [Verrucomicrobiota bacterium]
MSPYLTLTGNTWQLHTTNVQTVLLFEVPHFGLDQCLLSCQAQLKTKNLQGRAFLKMRELRLAAAPAR